MNNKEAMDALVAKRAAINAAINELNRYTQRRVGMDEVKDLARKGGVDISKWTGRE